MLIMLKELLFLSCAVLTYASPLTFRSNYILERRGCGTVATDGDRYETENALNWFRNAQLEAREVVNGTKGLKPASIDVYWHVVYANQTKEGGFVTDQQVMDQMRVINDDFKSTNITWVFKNVTRIENADWFVNAAPGMLQEQEMKRTYHRGDSSVLNIFTAQFNATTKTLGFASLPSSYLRDPLSDGLIIRHSTLPGGSHVNYNHGRTAVHELGHWLGLYHTFEGGCTGVGDNIDDTAPEASESVGCPVGRKSCPDSNEPDPINNFMDYSWDSCMTHFTPGQAVRMHEVIWAFRTRRPPVANTTSAAATASDGQTSLETGSVDGVSSDEGGGDPTSDDAELGSEDQEEPEGEDASEE